ncbi:MAG TPA: ATP-binding cassette domain-containing protein, partial [Bacteroidota bacterium]|nr:ATP-binding cassette domain-containing protein [Bacteroidota bacterium]
MSNLLQVKNISKSFGVIKAVSNVSFTLNEGEVIAIVGENGAGKSTLIKILSGVIKKDTGEIFLNNEAVEFNHPKEALESGISTVYQELSLCPNLTVAENIFVNREPSIYGIINKKELYKKT